MHKENFIDILAWRKEDGPSPVAADSPLANCVGKSDCDGPLKKPLDCEGLAPWVICDFLQCDNIKGASVAATVGGFDPAAKQEALIKSFSYGFDDGVGCKLEIFDRKGSTFGYFFEKLNKEFAGANKNYRMRIKFGWTCSTCPGIYNKNPRLESKCRYFLPHTIQKVYEKGAFKYIIEGIDTMQVAFQGKDDKVQGFDDKKMLLKEAVKQVYAQYDPPVIVEFVRPTACQTQFETIAEPFVDDAGKPATGAWKTTARDPMSAVADWKKDYVTDAGFGLAPRWDNGKADPTIKYVEQGCDSELNATCCYTYIVNGGKYSPVIAFNPEINWPFQAAENMGGGAGSTASGESIKRNRTQTNSQGCTVIIPVDENQGERTAIPPGNEAVENHGPDNAQRASDQSINAHTQANKTLYPMKAEMRVQGDPAMDNPMEWKTRKLSIVLINPFWPVENAGGGFCPDFLATPVCNPIFTNKNWIIEAVSHDIKEGSFVTTIKMYLVETKGQLAYPFSGRASGPNI